MLVLYLVDVSDIFYFFSARGGQRGVRGARREGGAFFKLKIPRGEGVFQEGPRGREGVFGIFGGGGAKFIFFLSEPKRPPFERSPFK